MFNHYRGEDRSRMAVVYGGDQGAPFIPNDQLFGIEVEPGDPATITYGALEGGSYQWYKDDLLLEGETGAAVEISAASLDDLGVYSLRLSNGGGEFRTVGIRLVVKLAPSVSTAPVPTAVGYGANATFSVGVAGPGPFTYQWYRNGEAIDGATASSHTVDNVGDADFGANFYVEITNAYGTVQSEQVSLDFDSTAVPGAVKPAFNGNLNSLTSIRAAVRAPDGRYYVGGSQFLHRLNTDGSIDETFAPITTSLTVDEIIIQPDGKILVAGFIWPVGGNPRDVARFLPSGAVDPTFEMDQIFGISDVNAMLLQPDGKIIIGGRFRNVRGVDKWNLARLNSDGTLDESYGPADEASGPNGYIYDMAWSDGKLLIAGEFTTYGGTTVNNLVRITESNTIDSSFGGGIRANGRIDELVSVAGGMFIRGQFKSYNGMARGGVARLHANGSLDTGFAPASGSIIPQGMAVGANGSVVLVGNFNGFGNWPAVDTVRLTSTGAIDTQWATPVDGLQFSSLIRLDDGTMLAGGRFDHDQNDETDELLIVELLGGDYPPQAPAISAQPRFTELNPAAGAITTMNALFSGPGELTVQWYRNGQALENSDMIQGVNEATLRLRSTRAVDTGDYVLRISSTEHGFVETTPVSVTVGEEQSGLGSRDLSWAYDGDLRPSAFALAEDGSIFTSSRISRDYLFKKFDSNGIQIPNTVFNPDVGVNVIGAAFQADGKILVWGSFTQFQGQSIARLARLNADGSLDTSFNPSPNGNLSRVLPLSDGRMFVLGGFTNIAGVDRRGLVRLNANGSLDSSFADAHDFHDGKRIVPTLNGDYFAIGTNYSSGTDRLILLNGNGSVDTSFAEVAAASGSMHALVVDEQKRPTVAGSFTTIKGSSRNRLARFSAAGVLDAEFGPSRSEGPNSTVYQLLLAPDGYLYVGGGFSRYDGFALGSLIRLDASGQIDLSFPADGVNRIFSFRQNTQLDWSDDNKLILAGDFSLSPRSGVVRLNVEGGPTGAPQLVDFAGDRIVVEGVDLGLFGRFEGGNPISYRWSFNGQPIAGANSPQLLLDNPSQSAAGTYEVTATNSAGSASVSMDVGFLSADPLAPVPGISLTRGFNSTLQQTIIRADGSRIVVGNFSQLEGINQRGIAAFTAEGQVDTAFNNNIPFSPTASSSVNRVIEEADGALLLLGNMYFPNTDPTFKRHFLVRLNANGSLREILLDQDDMTFGPNDIALLPDGKILLGHSRSEIGGVPVSRLARLNSNGSVDTSFLTGGMSGSVSRIFPAQGGGFYLSGFFSEYNGEALNSPRLIRIAATGERDSTFNPSGLIQSPIRLEETSEGTIYVSHSGGNAVATIDGVSQRLARLLPDGRLDSSFRTPFTRVDSFALDNLGRLVVGGQIPGTQWAYALARLLSNGAVDRYVDLSTAPQLLRREGERLFFGTGSSININGVVIYSLTYLNPGDAEGFALVDSPRGATLIPGESTVLGAGLRGATGATYQWTRNGEVLAGATQAVFAINNFSPADAGDYALEVTLDGETFTTEVAQVRERTNAMRAGEIDLAWGQNLSSTSVSGFGEDAAGNAYGFNFRTAPENVTYPLYAFDTDGTARSDFTLDPRVTSGTFFDLHGLADGKLLLGGSNLRVDGENAMLIRLNADGSIDDSFTRPTATGFVRSIDPMTDGRFFVSGSNLNGGQESFGIMSADGVFDDTITPMTGPSITQVVPGPDGKWWVFGQYTLPDTNNVRARIWRVNADGSLDETFSPYVPRSSESSYRIAAAPGGGFYYLSTYNSSALGNKGSIRRYTPEGDVDPGFQMGEFDGLNGSTAYFLSAFEADGQGRLVVTGTFSSYDGWPRNQVVRLLPDGSADPSFVSPETGSIPVSGSPQRVFVPQVGNRMMIFGTQFTGYGNLSDRAELYGLHYGELDAAAAPVLLGNLPAPEKETYERVALVAPVYAPASATVQWAKDGVAIAGANNWTYRLPALTPADSGSYTVTVTTSGGSITTSAVPLVGLEPGYSAAVSSFNNGAKIDSTTQIARKLPNGEIAVIAQHGAFVDGQGPYQLYFLNTDGTLNRGLPTRINGTSAGRDVNAITVDSAGRIYLGGSFTSVNGQIQNRIVRLLPDGSTDSTFDVGTGPNSSVQTLTLTSDDKLMVGGFFSQWNGESTVDGNSRARLIRLNLDGSVDTTFATGAGLNNYPRVLVEDAQGRYLVGGVFNLYNGFSNPYLLRLNTDGSIDNTLLLSPNNEVRQIFLQPDGRMLLVGRFSQIGGESRSGSVWIEADGSLGEWAGVSGSNVFSLDLADDGSIYYLQNQRVFRVLPDGSPDQAFISGDLERGYFTNYNNSRVTPRGVIASQGQVLLYGEFLSAGETELPGHAWIAPAESAGLRLTSVPSNQTVVPGAAVSWLVEAETTSGTLTYTWTKEADVSAVLSTSAGLNLINVTANDSGTYRVTVSNGAETKSAVVQLVVEGSIGSGPGTPRLDYYSDASDTFDSRFVGDRSGGGWIVRSNGILRVEADGSEDTSFQNPSLDSGVIQGVSPDPDGSLYVWGTFNEIDGHASARLARLRADGTVDTSFVASTFANSSLRELDIDPERGIYVYFASGSVAVGGTDTLGVVRLNRDGSVDERFNPGGGTSGQIYDGLIQPDGKLVIVGSFSEIGSAARTNMARLNPDGSIDTSFNNVNVQVVTRIVGLTNGQMLITGSFITVDGLSRPRVARLSADGYVDQSFGPIGGGFTSVQEIAVRPDGRIIAAGTYRNSSNQNRSGVAQLMPDGSLDPSFNHEYLYSRDLNLTQSSFVGLDVLPNGDVLVKGYFAYIDLSVNRRGLVLLEGSPMAPGFYREPQGPDSAGVGDRVVLSADAYGSGALSFQWRRDGTPIVGATGSTLEIPSASAGDSGEYSVVVTNVVGSATSGVASLDVQTAPVITGDPESVSGESGASVSFMVTYQANPVATVQWTFNGQPIDGATSDTLTLTNVGPAEVGDYRAVVTNDIGSTSSSAASFTLVGAPEITTQPVGTTVDPGANVTFTVVATGLPAPSYQWHLGGSEIPGATSASLSLTNVSGGDAGVYTVVVSNSVGFVTSRGAELILNAPPTFTTQPEGGTINEGDSITFTAEAVGPPAPTYQWFFNGGELSGRTDASYTISSANAGHTGTYTVVATNSQGSTTSSEAELVVNFAPIIITHPASQTVSRGDSVTLTAQAIGVPAPTLQWRKNGIAIDGATTASLTLNNVQAVDAGSYDLVATNSRGSRTTNAASLTVNVGPVITDHPESQTVISGSEVVFSVTASGGDPLTYQWRKDGNPIAGATGNSLTLSDVVANDAAVYDVVVTDPVDAVTSTGAILVVAEITATHEVAGRGYVPGGTVSVNVAINFGASVTELGISVLLPDDVGSESWSFVSENSTAQVRPRAGDTALAEWAWTALPSSPVDFTYVLNAPAAATGDISLTSLIELRAGSVGLQAPVNPDPLVLPQAPATHTADTNGDFQFSLSELLRVIQLYNTRVGTTRTGRYVPAESATEDGFRTDSATAKGAPPTFTNFHAADTNRDAEISLSELLRVIQLYNFRSGTTRTGQYKRSDGTEDGFAPGSDE
ncbi:MAG: hypothetical protein SynsKO_05770 [Synoicihabitans sp.]